LSQGLIYCDPSRELNFWRPTPSALLALGLRSHTDIPALKELEEWFDSQKEIQGIAKLDSFFERTSKLAARRIKREIERRGTLGKIREATICPFAECSASQPHFLSSRKLL
jgi:hypothetical protein